MNRDRVTISRQSGPIYANTYALRGIGIRYNEPFPIPGPAILPVAWRMRQLPSEDNFRFDFSKEREVLEQAAIRRRAIVGEAGNQQPARPDGYNRVESFPLSSSIPLIPYLSSAVLTPTRVPSEGESNSQTSIAQGGGSSSMEAGSSVPPSQQSVTQPLGELSLKDFEGDAADPFEMATLQAIDVLAELQDVLQPSSSVGSSSVSTSAVPSIATTQTPSVTQPSTSPTIHLRSVQPVAHSGSPIPTPPTPRANRVEIAPTTSGYAPPTMGYPTPGYAPPITSGYAPPTTAGYPQLIDIEGASSPQPKPQVSPPPPPRPPKPRVTFNVPPVPARDSVTDPAPQRQPFAGGVPVLPSISPATQQRQPLAGGVSVLPPIPRSQQPPATPPPYQQLSNIPPSSEPVLPPYSADGPPTSQPFLPPYPSNELSSYQQQQEEEENLYGSRPYRLPDVQASLPLEMKESLRNISGMGFPSPRVARALKRCDGDDQKVFDFLLLMGEIVDKGYNGDSAEIALLYHEEKIDKSIEYLDQVERYKEVWPETSIHSAYQQAGKDWDKTVDILTQGTS